MWMSKPSKNLFYGVLILAIFTFLPLSSLKAAEPSLIVHEWGTITTQHYPDGSQAGSLNRIRPTEVLPDFVHHLKTQELDKVKIEGFAKIPGSPPYEYEINTQEAGHPDVTMRLETPVIYFYPQKGFDTSKPLDVHVDFKGGLLNEYYPEAKSTYEGITADDKGAHLTDTTVGTLSWDEITLDASGKGPETDFKVWLSPRATQGERRALLYLKKLRRR